MPSRLRAPFAVLAALCIVATGLVAAALPQTCLDESGGQAVAHRAGGIPATGDNAPLARLCRIGIDAAEPTLGLTADGTIFAIASPTNTDIQVAKSIDKGATWTNVAPPIVEPVYRHMVDLDPYLFVDPVTQRIFFADLYAACSEMSFSDNAGATWTTNPATCGSPVNDHQTIFTGPPVGSSTIGYPSVVYYCFQNLIIAGCSKSLDGGLVFIPPTAAAYTTVAGTNGTLCSSITGHGVAGPDGAIYLPKANYCGPPTLAISRDEGASWTRVNVANTTGAPDHEASVAVDDAGNIHYVWVAADRLPYLVSSSDGGATWSAPRMVAAPGVSEANLPSIDAGAAGKVAIAYHGSTNSPGAPWPSAGYATTTWNAYMTITDSALAADPLFYSAPVNNTADPIILGRCGPGRCGLVFDFIDVVVGPAGDAWSVWVDACMGSCLATGKNSGAGGFVGHLQGGPSLS